MSKDVLISNLIEAVNKALDTSSLDKRLEALTNELNDMYKEFELLVKDEHDRAARSNDLAKKSMQNLKIFIKTKKESKLKTVRLQ